MKENVSGCFFLNTVYFQPRSKKYGGALECPAVIAVLNKTGSIQLCTASLRDRIKQWWTTRIVLDCWVIRVMMNWYDTIRYG